MKLLHIHITHTHHLMVVMIIMEHSVVQLMLKKWHSQHTQTRPTNETNIENEEKNEAESCHCTGLAQFIIKIFSLCKLMF